ncbi:hypothetical protein QQ045_022586 [Rhodiola kirilowii]
MKVSLLSREIKKNPRRLGDRKILAVGIPTGFLISGDSWRGRLRMKWRSGSSGCIGGNSDDDDFIDPPSKNSSSLL